MVATGCVARRMEGQLVLFDGNLTNGETLQIRKWEGCAITAGRFTKGGNIGRLPSV